MGRQKFTAREGSVRPGFALNESFMRLLNECTTVRHRAAQKVLDRDPRVE